jgi:hypothetical protein
MLVAGWAGTAQTVDTKYYNKNFDEVDPKKATISEVITQNQDGTVTTTTNTLKRERSLEVTPLKVTSLMVSGFISGEAVLPRWIMNFRSSTPIVIVQTSMCL